MEAVAGVMDKSDLVVGKVDVLPVQIKNVPQVQAGLVGEGDDWCHMVRKIRFTE